MKSRLRNVTITLDEDVARWARIEAAKRDISVSRMIADLLREEMLRSDAYEDARRRDFAQEPRVHRKPGQRLPTRDELHERANLR